MFRYRLYHHAAAVAVLLGTASLGACVETASPYLDRTDSIAFSAGNAVETNIVTHVHDPWPVHAKNKNIAFSGERMAIAVRNYQCGQSGLGEIEEGGGGSTLAGGMRITSGAPPPPPARPCPTPAPPASAQ